MFQMTVVFLFQGNWFSPINLWQVEAEDLFDDFTLNIKDQLFGTAKELGQVELFVPATPWLVSANLLGKNLQSSAWITSTVGSVEAEWPHFAKEKKLGLGFLRGNISETVVFGIFPQHHQNLVWFFGAGNKRRTTGHKLRHQIWEEREQLQQEMQAIF